jgi:hypothetical protein
MKSLVMKGSKLNRQSSITGHDCMGKPHFT